MRYDAGRAATSCHLVGSSAKHQAISREEMNREEQVQTLGSLYLLYRFHAAELQKVGFTNTEAFWLNFASLPFLPWDTLSENRLHLTPVLRLYLGIYQYNAPDPLKPEAIPAFLELLADRHRMAKHIASIEDASQREVELGRFALPGEKDTARIARASSIVLHSIAEWQRQEGEDRLPCVLVDDLDEGSVT
jgi:hypothetical protein